MMLITIFAVIIILLLIVRISLIVSGPSDWHRLQGLALFSSKSIILIVLFSLLSDISFILDMAVVYTLLGFIGTMLLARYFSKRKQI
jgi:multisubunit Na+/H+ antiporter MnhF subunit